MTIFLSPLRSRKVVSSSPPPPTHTPTFFPQCVYHHFLSAPHFNTLTQQHINTSTHQHSNTATHQRINISTLNTSTYQHINTSTHQHVNTSIHQRININTSTHQHTNTPTHQHMICEKKYFLDSASYKKKTFKLEDRCELQEIPSYDAAVPMSLLKNTFTSQTQKTPLLIFFWFFPLPSSVILPLLLWTANQPKKRYTFYVF